jgi:redox-sensitive bicupin YhaK (pirin superfamily)
MNNNSRRSFLGKFSVSVLSALGIANSNFAKTIINNANNNDMPPILNIKPMGFTWECIDPFIFCAHHEDYFPAGNAEMGPTTNLDGRHLGDDFIIKDGFRMYHGKKVPGFPGHPHRGFETVTIVRKGTVDHSDSLGASGRYGDGDVQWMTAGQGVQHSEMFPLIHSDRKNTMELFQIWLNLPAKKKMVKPHFSMLWKESIPIFKHADALNRKTQVEIIAGKIGQLKAPTPPPNSWANDPKNEVAIWNILMEPGAEWTLPKASPGINRTIYYYEGDGLNVAGQTIGRYQAIELQPDVEVTLKAGTNETSILVLQGRPIGETVIQYGPFVMNSKAEINQAFEDFHKTKFGGWPWPKYDQVHDRNLKRFAKHADGRMETKES